MTINQKRWIDTKIRDRIDLTLECIRLFYLKETSPLEETLERYGGFFELFNNFQWYCEYFLLDDLIDTTTNSIKFFLPFKDFYVNPIPQNVWEYYTYMENNIIFLEKRNQRIKAYSKKH